MTAGHAYMFLSLVSFSLIGIFAKVADGRDCRPAALYALVYFWALALVSTFAFGLRGASAGAPAQVYWIALPFGMCAAVAGIAFQVGIRYGKISTSWLVINLSAAIPTVGSILIYREPVSARKLMVISLVVISILLLWKDKQVEDARNASGLPAGEEG
jgi:drug/metabolite transporter (DMT)-like permease